MIIYKAKDYQDMSRKAANIISAQVIMKPNCVLGLATGSSPIGTYEQLVEWYNKGDLDFSKVTSINLDEYKGLGPDNEQSYRYFMDSNLFDHINIDKANTYVAKGTGDIEANIEEFRAVIAKSQVELQVLGVGADGHLAFNEPGPSLYWSAHKETLDESTIDANARFFASREEVPRYAVTMGIGEIMMAKRLLMILSGANKEEAARLLLMSDDVTCACPATLMKLHHDATVLITKELADKIGYQG